MVCDRHDLGGRRGGQLGDATDVFAGRGDRPTLAARIANLNPLGAALVAHADETFPVAEPLGLSITDAAAGAVFDDGLLPERHRERPPARNQRERRPIRARRKMLEALGDLDEAAYRLRR